MSQYAFDPVKPVVKTKFGQLRGSKTSVKTGPACCALR